MPLQSKKKRIEVYEKVLLLTPLIIFMFLGDLPRSIWLVNELCIWLMVFTVLRKPGFVRYVFNRTSLIVAAIFLFITLNACINGINFMLFIKTYDTFKTVSYLLFVIYLFNEKDKDDFENFLDGILFILLAASFTINSVVMIIQIFDYKIVNYDNISGLVGETSTGVILVMWIAFLCAIIYKIMQSNKWYLFFALAISLSIMIFLAYEASIRAFYIVAPFILFISFLPRFIINRKKTFINVVYMSVFSFFLFLMLSPDKLTENLFFNMNQFHNARFSGTFDLNKAKDERIEMIKYSLKQDYALLCGNGIGSRTEIFGFYGKEFYFYPKHLKMTDMSLIIYESGIWYYLLVILLFFLLFRILHQKRLSWIILINTILFSSYIPLFSDERSTYLFIIMSCYLLQNYKNTSTAKGHYTLINGRSVGNTPSKEVEIFEK